MTVALYDQAAEDRRRAADRLAALDIIAAAELAGQRTHYPPTDIFVQRRPAATACGLASSEYIVQAVGIEYVTCARCQRAYDAC